MNCPRCFRPLNEGNSPNLEECHAGDDDEDCQCELSAKIHRLKGSLNAAIGSTREVRLHLMGRGVLSTKEVISLLALAEQDYREVLKS